MAKVTELRVHGVGGANARQLLDARSDTEVVQVDGGATSGFFQLRDPPDSDHVAEAYVWGGLNSKALTSGLWWLLLPFTLVNVAGWMLRPSRARRAAAGREGRRGVRLGPYTLLDTRSLVRVGGAGLTIVYVLYLLVLFVDVGAMRCGSDPACTGRWWLEPLRWFPVESDVGHPVWRAAVGLSIALGLVGLLFGVSARNRRLHESAVATSVSAGERVEGRTVQLNDPQFWYQLPSPGALYRLHLGAATTTVGFAAGTTLAAASTEHGWPDDGALRAWLVVFGVLAVALIGVLARPDRFDWQAGKYHDKLAGQERARFRLAIVGWALLHNCFVGFAGLAGWAWRRNAPAGDAFAEHGFIELIWRAALVGVLPFVLVLLVVQVKRQWGMNLSHVGAFLRQLWMGFDRVPEAASPTLLRDWCRERFGRQSRRSDGAIRRPRSAVPGFRIYPVPAAIGLGLLLVFAGFSAVLVRVIALLQNGETSVQLGSSKIGGNSSFFAFSVVVTAAVVLFWYRRPSSRKAARVATRADYAPELAELPELTESPEYHSWVRSVAYARLHAEIGRRADVLLSLFLLVFSGTLLVLVIKGGGAESSPLFGWTWLETLGSWVLVIFLFPGVFVLRAAIRARDSRQRVGKVWDVLTLWPRTYHPLAAPCYAERAVPELRDRIRALTDNGGAVVLAAHSQGTVLCYAAVLALSQEPGAAQRLERVSIVSQGSPIRQLFMPFFPEFFTRDDLHTAAGGCDPRGSWVNFYRDTDYIGKQLFAAPAASNTLPTEAAPSDVRLLDPRKRRFPLQRHSNYDQEPLVQEWIVTVVEGRAVSGARSGSKPEPDPKGIPGT